MTYSASVTDRASGKDSHSIIQVGLKAYDLAVIHQSVIDVRLPGARGRLMTDLETLGVVLPSASAVHDETKPALGMHDAAVKPQETTRTRAPVSTQERNLTVRRVLRTAVLIAGAGLLAFGDDPLAHASFVALMANTRWAGISREKPPVETKKPKPTEAPQA